MKSEGGAYRTVALVLLATSLLFAGVATYYKCETNRLRHEAIQRAVAHYNQTTGVWEWVVEKI